MFRPFVLAAAALALLPAAASAQDSAQSQAETGQPPQRIRQVTLTGSEKCPTAAADEIVVCSRLDPNEQFRVPKSLRQAPEVPAQNQSWVNRAAAADQTGRIAGGLPNTCSPVGSGGQSGCAIQAGRAWAAERRQAQRETELPASERTTTTTVEDDDTPPQE
jgi:hypothetical protein